MSTLQSGHFGHKVVKVDASENTRALSEDNL